MTSLSTTRRFDFNETRMGKFLVIALRRCRRKLHYLSFHKQRFLSFRRLTSDFDIASLETCRAVHHLPKNAIQCVLPCRPLCLGSSPDFAALNGRPCVVVAQIFVLSLFSPSNFFSLSPHHPFLLDRPVKFVSTPS